MLGLLLLKGDFMTFELLSKIMKENNVPETLNCYPTAVGNTAKQK